MLHQQNILGVLVLLPAVLRRGFFCSAYTFNISVLVQVLMMSLPSSFLTPDPLPAE